MSKAQAWDDLPGLVDDEMLHTVATLGTHDRIAGQLNERYGERVDRIEFSMPVNNPEDAAILSDILTQLG